jgi:hypothetical protein
VKCHVVLDITGISLFVFIIMKLPFLTVLVLATVVLIWKKYHSSKSVIYPSIPPMKSIPSPLFKRKSLNSEDSVPQGYPEPIFSVQDEAADILIANDGTDLRKEIEKL